MLISWANLGITLVFAAVIPEIVMYYVNRYRKHAKQNAEHLNEVMFFTDKGFQCKEHYYNRLICTKDSCSYRHLRRLIELLEMATSSLDVCMYFITSQELSETIVRVHRKGVSVRIIADAAMADGSGTQIPIFRKHGVPVRMKKTSFLMHHKFLVINKAILISGSCNWTSQAFAGNWDNIIVTSAPALVVPFSQHFSQLWEEFSEMDHKLQV